MKAIKENRLVSFIVMALIYLLCTVCGVVLYWKLPYPFWLSLLVSDVVMTVLTFVFSLIFGNASVYDPYWSVQPIVIVWAFAMGRTLTVLRVMMLFAVTGWGLRLTANWAYTFYGLNHQDWRYTMLHEKTGKLYPLVNFVGIHMVPTLIVYACTLPAVFAMVYESEFHPVSVIFFLLSVAAFTMQGIADIQMHSFRLRKQAGATSEPFVRDGLWAHSRHPNYLGEILMWWGVGLCVVCNMPQRWYLLIGAVANNLLFLAVSIPMADGRQRAKPEFEAYKAETRRLLPVRK